ncbi:hypothetical protein SmJEL517_g05667 [Synchytrium microbalum]|uniref:Nucleoporin NSP1-like C-terminal domain-containing protein n=1 Tax=Synchytrium microbalum TaxID=1806994 RepID=A0A507BYL2_9FUNG|nr:uncharacterized protein SmJEL517_g05667 [Synchytrium microbalum]TPX30894.1 hypothetical protein SmJEL517_g05667 [Synchytrium microbalum]
MFLETPGAGFGQTQQQTPQPQQPAFGGFGQQPAAGGAAPAFGGFGNPASGGFGVTPPAQPFGSQQAPVAAFGQPAASTTPSFGQPAGQQQQPAGAPTTGLFGQAAAAPPAFGFGQQAPAAQPSALFGGASPASQPPAAATGPAFGNPSAPSAGFGFGAPASSIAPTFGAAPNSTGLFGTSSAPAFGQQAAQPATSAPAPLFGQAPAAAPAFGAPANAAPSNIFGGGSQQPPTSGLSFGQAPASTMSFGQNVAQPPATQAATGFGGISFGAQPQVSATAATPAAPTPNLFGGQAPTSQSPFGAQAAPTGSTNLFGAASQQPPTSLPSSQPAPSFPFGQPAAASTAGVGSTNLFGSAPQQTSTGLPQPAAAVAQAPSFGTTSAPPSISFGAPSTTAAPSLSLGAPATTAAPSISFGAPATTAAPSISFGAPATSAPPTSAPAIFAAPPATAVSQAPASTAQSGFSFPGMPASAIKGALPTTTTAAAPGVLETPGPLKISDLGTPATKPPTPSLFAPSAATTAVAGVSSSTGAGPAAGAVSTLARSVGPSSSLKNKTVEQIVNDWKTQTMKHEQEFRKLAVDIGRWDLMLWKNGEELTKLTKEVESAEETQRLIDQNLEYIESEQSQMDEALATYEAEIRKIFDSDGPERIRMTPADQEREKAYGLAATLNSQFDDMLRHLSSMVEDINATIHPSAGEDSGSAVAVAEGGESAYTQVVRILNHHLSSLRWLDSQVSQLDRRVGEIERYRSAAESVVSRVYGPGGGSGGMAAGGMSGNPSNGDWTLRGGR